MVTTIEIPIFILALIGALCLGAGLSALFVRWAMADDWDNAMINYHKKRMERRHYKQFN